MNARVSWLELERYQLGELDAAGRARVEAALAASDALRARLQTIVADVRPLPALPTPLGAPKRDRGCFRDGAGGEKGPGKISAGKISARLSFAAMAAAAAILVLVAMPREPQIRPAIVAVKGGEMALRIVREHAGHVATELDVFSAGDRFKAVVTCPPGERGHRFIVFQAGEASEPLALSRLACANNVALPGAFSFTTTAPALACFVQSAAAIARAEDLPRESVCVTIGAKNAR